MKLTTIFLLLFCICDLSFAQNKTTTTPQIFQEGIISKGDYESHPAFSPTGDTLYFIKCSFDLKVSAICVSYKRKGKWTEPEVASFSGHYMDADPFVARDGKTLYFMSNRPRKDGDPVKDDTDIFMVKLTASGWGAPVRLEAPVNSEADEYYPTIADNGNIYFGSPRKGGLGGSDIWRCRYENGKYLPAENLGDAINTAGNDFEAFIAPDESYIIYNSNPIGFMHLDFYISYNINGKWTKAVKIPEPLNSDGIEWSPKVTRDKKWFYFSSTRNRWANTPAKAENMQQLNKRLQSAGNSLADIYLVDFGEIEKLRK